MKQDKYITLQFVYEINKKRNTARNGINKIHHSIGISWYIIL